MKVVLTGGTGYIGSHLVRALLRDGHECVVVTRGKTDPWSDDRVRLLRADPTAPGAWQAEVEQADAVVNLAGARLVEPPHRWTATRKQVIRESRIATTRHVAEAVARASEPPSVLISGSAVGYYGDRGDEQLDETAPPGDDFLAQLCVDWETAAGAALNRTRLVTLRTGLVLGPESPLLQSMLPPFKLGIGGPWGTGRQWWPWVHLDDVVAMIQQVLTGDLTGPLNVTAPNPVRVAEFAKTLGHVLHRPAIARIPEFVLRLALGEVADALLASQRVIPTKAIEAGFRFSHPDLEPALAGVLNKKER